MKIVAGEGKKHEILGGLGRLVGASCLPNLVLVWPKFVSSKLATAKRGRGAEGSDANNLLFRSYRSPESIGEPCVGYTCQETRSWTRCSVPLKSNHLHPLERDSVVHCEMTSLVSHKCILVHGFRQCNPLMCRKDGYAFFSVLVVVRIRHVSFGGKSVSVDF